MQKKYPLTKQEIDSLNNLLTVRQFQDEIALALTDRFRNSVLEILRKHNEKPEVYQFTRINFGEGEIVIEIPETPKPVEKQE